MPYDASEPDSLPAYVRQLPAKRQRQWADIWNSTYASCMRGLEPNSGNCESKAFSVASGVVIQQGGKAKHSMTKAAEFKKLTYQARQNLPGRKFLVPRGSDGKPHLPVHDEAHIRNTISRLGSPKTGRKWGLTDQKRASLQARARKMLGRAQHSEGPPIGKYGDLAMDVATFRLKAEPVRMTDDLVYRPATIFRSGNYPDKDFDLTPSELKDAAAKFDKPIPVDYEHIDGPLDGHMGQLVAVQPSEDGTRLHGMVAVPQWLNTILPKAKLSATWDRASKTLVGLALVRNPRVSDAALFAAFSVDQIARGEKPIESLLSAFNDGDNDADDKDEKPNPFVKIAKKKNKAAEKTSKKAKAKFAGYDGMVPAGGWESQSGGARDGVSSVGDIGKKGRKFALGKGPWSGGGKGAMAQAVHDIAASRGAVCRVEPEPAVGAPGPYGIVRFDKDGNVRLGKKKLAEFASKGKAMQGIHDVSLAMGAKCAPTLYGQQSLEGGGPWQWQWPGIKDEGYHEVVRGGMTKPHFSQGGKAKAMGKKKAMFNRMLADLDATKSGVNPAAYGYAKGSKKGAAPQMSTADRALAERNAHLETENARLIQQGIYDRAVTFADRAVTEGHILPAEREDLMTQHMQAAHDDWKVGTAAFNEGDTRVSQLEKWILGKQAHGMDVEAMRQGIGEVSALFNNMRSTIIPGSRNSPGVESGAPMTPERRSYLLNLADSGTMTGRNLARSTNGTSK